MPKYLIEVTHGSEKLECIRSVSILLNTGSHFLTNADWGCLDGVHKAWFIMDVESKKEAMMIIPPAYRKDTKISQLNKFTLKDMEEMLKHHESTA
jgi:hypothetical protein